MCQVDLFSGQITSHVDVWDALQNNRFVSLEGVQHVLRQFFQVRRHGVEVWRCGTPLSVCSERKRFVLVKGLQHVLRQLSQACLYGSEVWRCEGVEATSTVPPFLPHHTPAGSAHTGHRVAQVRGAAQVQAVRDPKVWTHAPLTETTHPSTLARTCHGLAHD
eukprot:108845-Chlamydomonas_euryale.AAC.1